MKVALVVMSNSEVVATTKNNLFGEMRSALFKNSQDVVWFSTIKSQSELLSKSIDAGLADANVVIVACENSVDKMYMAKRVLCDKFACSLENSLFAKKNIDDFCSTFNVPLRKEDNAYYQMPSVARTIKNPIGLFQGCLLEKDEKIVFLLPLEHEQLRHMFFSSVLPYILQCNKTQFKTFVFKTFGIKHQEMLLLLKEFFANKQNIEVVCSEFLLEGEVVLKVSNAARQDFVDNFVKTIYTKLLPYVYSDQDESMEEFIKTLLVMQNKTIVFAEDFTGGAMASAFFSNIADASKFLKASFVTVDKESKQKILGVQQNLLEKPTVDCGEVAYQMAVGALKASGADVAVSSFGNIESGKLWFAIGTAEGVHVFDAAFEGGLQQKIAKAKNTIFFKLIKKIKQTDFHLGETVI